MILLIAEVETSPEGGESTNLEPPVPPRYVVVIRSMVVLINNEWVMIMAELTDDDVPRSELDHAIIEYVT